MEKWKNGGKLVNNLLITCVKVEKLLTSCGKLVEKLWKTC